MNLAHKSTYIFAINWVLFGIYLLTNIFIVRWLGAEGKGTIALLSATITILASLGHLGIPAAAIYYLRNGTYNERTLCAHFFVVTVIVSVLAGALIWTGKETFAFLFLTGIDFSDRWIILMCIGLPNQLMANFLATLWLANENVLSYSLIQIGVALLGLAGTIYLVAILHMHVTGVLLATQLSQSVMLLVQLCMLFNTSREQKINWAPLTMLTLLKFGLKHYTGTLGAVFFKRANNFLLAYFIDAKAVGYYSVAMIPHEVILSIPRAANSLMAGRASSKEHAYAGPFVARSTCFIFWGMSAIAAITALLAPWIVAWMFGPDFAIALPSLYILLISAVLLGSTTSLQTYFLATARPGINGILSLSMGVINLIFSFLLIPKWNITGNAMGTLAGSLSGIILHVFLFHRFTKLALSNLYKFKLCDIHLFNRKKMAESGTQ